MIKFCQRHGDTPHALSGSRLHCKACKVEAVIRRRKKVKELSVAYKGGSCIDCGYKKCTSALEFHHRDSSQKDFGISASGWTISWVKIMVELDKCDLLCANCHRERHHLNL